MDGEKGPGEAERGGRWVKRERRTREIELGLKIKKWRERRGLCLYFSRVKLALCPLFPSP